MTSSVVKVLLTGCNGQVGWEYCERASEFDTMSVVATDVHNLDITDQEAVRAMIEREQVDVVVNAAAYTAVDKAESEEALAQAVNVTGPEYLSTESNRAGIPILHISTDYVFDGNTTTPYTEGDRPSPASVYGRTKLAGEDVVHRCNPRAITLRTSWVFGRVGGNFVRTMVRLAGEQNELRVVADQFGSPTYAGDLADALLSLTLRCVQDAGTPWGLYHYCGQGPTTWYAFASRIIDEACSLGIVDQKPVVKPIRTDEFETAAERPGYAVLNCTHLDRTFPDIGLPSWETGLTDVLNAIAEGASER
ncbi:MAG: dTDP-4-dehydrorhamnose reductase [Pseudomonadota bacterium]